MVCLRAASERDDQDQSDLQKHWAGLISHRGFPVTFRFDSSSTQQPLKYVPTQHRQDPANDVELMSEVLI